MSRERELVADSVGAEAASAGDLAVALIKLEAFSGAWGSAYSEAVRAVQEGQSPNNVSTRFHELAILGARPSHVSDVDHGRISHPTDSHPPTSERLRALGVDARAEVSRAIDLEPADSSYALIDDGDALEADLMEDLEEKLGEPNVGEAEGDSFDRSAEIREAATADPAVADLVTLTEVTRGRDLQPPIRPWEPWQLLADLDVRPHPEPTAFGQFDPAEALPSGDQQLVMGIASGRTPTATRVRAGTRLRLIGMSFKDVRRSGRTEMMFDVGGRILTIRAVGDWPIEHQIGGLFVAPISDPLVGDDSRLRERLDGVIRALVDRADRVTHS
jgi:hypothetical protein